MKTAILTLLIFSFSLTVYGKDHELTFYKGIEAGDTEMLQQQVNELQIEPGDTLTLKLNSFGGLTGSAMNIEAFLRWLNSKGVEIITKVEDGAICASACVIVFSAGDKRYAYNESLFIFHAPILGDLKGEEYDRIWKIVVTSYLDSIRRADPVFADYVERTKISQQGQTELFASDIEAVAPDYMEILESNEETVHMPNGLLIQ